MFIASAGDAAQTQPRSSATATHNHIHSGNHNNNLLLNVNKNNNSFRNNASTPTTTTNLTGFQQETTIRNGLLFLKGLRSNLAESMEQCVGALEQSGLPTTSNSENGTKWCDATWDTVLCWPATPANSSITLQCPPLKGLDPTKNITKFCHASGRWMGKLDGDFSRSHGWTNFTMCFTEEVVYIMKNLNNGSLGIAQDVAQNARKLEFVGLGLSLVSLILSILIFSCFRRLRVFRNLLHLQLMIAILMVVIIRLVLYIDLIFTDRLGHVLVNPEGKTINTMVIVCESMFFLLEYFKSVAFWWMFLEGFYLHNQLVLTVFNTDPKLWPYFITGYGVPLFHTIIWLLVIIYKKQGNLERCLGSYYLEPEFWILDGPRMLQLVVNTFFISNVIRVLWTKVRNVGNTGEVNRMKKSVKAALMLIPLLGIPNIMQTIPFSPTHENITYFAIWTYCASFTYMYQGLMIAIIYCFTNKEVQTAVRNYYYRYRLQHVDASDFRRASRSLPNYCQPVVANGGGNVKAAALKDSVKKKCKRRFRNTSGGNATEYETYHKDSSIIANDSLNIKLLSSITDDSNFGCTKRNVVADKDNTIENTVDMAGALRNGSVVSRTNGNGAQSFRNGSIRRARANGTNRDDERTPIMPSYNDNNNGERNARGRGIFAFADDENATTTTTRSGEKHDVNASDVP